VPGWSNDQHDAMLEQWTLLRRLTRCPVDRRSAAPTPRRSVGHAGWDNFPLKIVSIHGQRYLYVGVLVETKESGFAVGRYLTRYVSRPTVSLPSDQGLRDDSAGSLACASDVVLILL